MLPSRKRKLRIALVVILIAAAITAVVLVRRRSAPEPARLLPEADAVVYVNLHLLRLGRVFENAPPVSHDPEYEQFVQATGFQFERDLDQAAVAVHASGSPLNPGGGGPGSFTEQARFSEVFRGHFDGTRVSAYLRKLAASIDPHAGIEIFNIPHEGRTVRVAILGVDMVAVSNVGDPEVIRLMIDKYRAAAAPLSGPTIISEYYRRVPIGSVMWAIARFAPNRATGQVGLLGGLQLPGTDLAGSAVVASARYVGSIHLKVEDFARNEQAAKNLAQNAETFVTLFRGAETSVGGGGADADVKALFNSIKVDRQDNRVWLTATVPAGFISKILSAPPTPEPEATAPEQPEAAPKKPRRKP
jgi:hypothetical protein